MNAVQRALYQAGVCAVKVYQRFFLDLRIWGREDIPAGPKIYASNHITALDGAWVLPVFREPVHYVIGAPYQIRMLGKVWDFFDQINGLPKHRKTVVDEAVRRIERGGSIYICPEGDFHQQFNLGRFYHGIARIYLRTHAPIVPIALVAPTHRLREYPFPTVVDGRVYRLVVVLRGPFLINVGTPMQPTWPEHGTDEEKDEAVVSAVKERIAALVEDVRVHKFWLS